MVTTQQNSQMQAVLTSAYYTFEKGLKTHALYKMNNRVVSQDLVQDTFLKTWKYLVKGGKIDAMKSFLYHVLNFLIVDEYRKHKTTSLDVLIEEGFEPSDDDHQKLFNQLDGKAALQQIQRLPVKYRTVMRMRYVQDLSISEISNLTGLSKNTVAVQVHRGLAQLRRLCLKT